ncbi:MAG: GNAT family N-acetyltransferase, partial [Saprospiraceae bacterium]
MLKFSLRPYQANDEKVINQLFNEIFSTKRTVEEWRYKFGKIEQNSTILLAVSEADQIVGQYAALQFDLLVDGKTYRAGQPVDVFCSKQQGTVQQRVYLKLVKAFFERYGNEAGLPVLFGFPGERALKLGRYKLNYGTPRPIPFFTKKVKYWYVPYLKKLSTEL